MEKTHTAYVRLVTLDPIDAGEDESIAVGDRFEASPRNIEKVIKQMRQSNEECANNPDYFVVVRARLCNGDCARCPACQAQIASHEHSRSDPQ